MKNIFISFFRQVPNVTDVTAMDTGLGIVQNWNETATRPGVTPVLAPAQGDTGIQ